MRNTLFAMLIASATAAACAARTDVPQTSIQAPAVVAPAVNADASVERDWWRQFDDPALDALIDEAFAANRDIHAAASRLMAARELAGVARLAHLPSGGAGVAGARQHLSEREAGGLSLPSRTAGIIDIGADLAWEADVFGRLRGRARAVAAEAGVAAMDVRAVQVAVAADVASAYFEWRGAGRDLELFRAMRERTADLVARTTTLATAGRLTRLDVLRVQQVDDELAAEQAMAGHAAERARLRLATLTGRTGDAWVIPAASPRDLRVTRLPIGSIADVIRRRPDIAAADQRLRAAGARHDASRADLFPRVELTGGLGLVAGSVGQLAEASSVSWFVAPRLVWTFLDWPRLKRQMRAAGALTDAAFAEYEQTVLRALEEVHGAVDAYGAASDRLLATERRRDAASGAASIVAVQYREGMVDSLARALAERDEIAGTLTANRALTDHRQAVVSVYRALGGGWR